MRNLKRATITSGAVFAMLAGQAQAVTVGQTAPSPAAVSNCGGATLFVSPQVASGTPTYAVPEGGGVLTSWSVQGDNTTAGILELKVVREIAGNTYRVVAEDPQPRNIAVNTLNTFDVRIPVSAGELLALWVPAGTHPCTFSGAPGDVMEFRAGTHAEPGVGQTFVTDTDSPNFRTNVSANLEPDTIPPEARITKGAPNKTDKNKIKFRFRSNEPGSTFECKLDRRPWKPCSSPKTVRRLDEGKHKFKVRATDAVGNVGTPDKDKFKVVD